MSAAAWGSQGEPRGQERRVLGFEFSREKEGGAIRSEREMDAFRDALDDCGYVTWVIRDVNSRGRGETTL